MDCRRDGVCDVLATSAIRAVLDSYYFFGIKAPSNQCNNLFNGDP